MSKKSAGMHVRMEHTLRDFMRHVAGEAGGPPSAAVRDVLRICEFLGAEITVEAIQKIRADIKSNNTEKKLL